MKRIFLLGSIVLVAFQAGAKEKMGVAEQDLKQMLVSAQFQIDRSAHAVVLRESGSVAFSYSDRNAYNDLTIERMVRIIDDKGMDATDVSVRLNQFQSIASVKTITYSLVNKRTLVEKEPDEAYTQTKDDTGRLVKLNFKNAAPGTVIYYTYKIKTAKSYNIPAWYFEGKYPVLHSEFVVTADYGLDFAVISNKNTPFPDVSEESDKMLCSDCRYSINQNNTSVQTRSSLWARNNIAAVKGELNKKRENIRIQLAAIRNSRFQTANQSPYNLNQSQELLQNTKLDNWDDVNAKLLYNGSDLGKIVYGTNGNLKETLATVLQGKTSDMDKAQAIFAFVQNSIRLKNNEEGIYAGNSLKTILEEKEGTAAEKNILLVSLMRKAGLDCQPVVLITNEYEPLRADFPVYSALNYVAGRFSTGGKEYLLDAANTGTAFGKLSPQCYNGTGYVVDKQGSFVNLGE